MTNISGFDLHNCIKEDKLKKIKEYSITSGDLVFFILNKNFDNTKVGYLKENNDNVFSVVKKPEHVVLESLERYPSLDYDLNFYPKNVCTVIDIYKLPYVEVDWYGNGRNPPYVKIGYYDVDFQYNERMIKDYSHVS